MSLSFRTATKQLQTQPTSLQGCIFSKVNCGRENLLTKEAVLIQLKKVNECVSAYPKSYHKKLLSGDEYGKPIFEELTICKDILGAHYNDMLNQDDRNKIAKEKAVINGPTAFNTKAYILPPTKIKKRISIIKQSAIETNCYIHQDKLQKLLEEKELYELVKLFDTVMEIDTDGMPGRNERYKA
eukprot:489550-Ditylum_brightwellii.AAC.1